MFKRLPKPTFKGIVSIAIAGDEPGLIEFEFNTLRKKEYDALLADLRADKLSEEAFLARLIAGWNYEHPESLVDEPFSGEALTDLLDRYWGAAVDVHVGYMKALAEARRKN
jgi:hypothetical protein